MNARVLVVDDEQPLVRLVRDYLTREGYEVLEAFDGEAALSLARERQPDLIVLDLMLPKVDGVEVCRRVRTFSDAYIIMLTAKSEEVDKLVGLSVGADDYLTKPFSPRELVARVKAMLRRPRPATAGGGAPTSFDNLVIDSGRREVTRDGSPLELTRIEFDLLATLSERPGFVWTREQLLDRVWRGPYFGDDHVVDVHIANLRKKLGDDPARPRYLFTVRGVGYRLGA